MTQERQKELREGLTRARKNRPDWLYMDGNEELDFILGLLKEKQQ